MSVKKNITSIITNKSKFNTIVLIGLLLCLILLIIIFVNKSNIRDKKSLLQKIEECNKKIQTLLQSDKNKTVLENQNEKVQLIEEYNKLIQYLFTLSNEENQTFNLVNIVDNLCNSTEPESVLKEHNIILDEIFNLNINSKKEIVNSIQSLCKLKLNVLTSEEKSAKRIEEIIAEKQQELNTVQEQLRNESTIAINNITQELNNKETEYQALRVKTDEDILVLNQRINQLQDTINVLNPQSMRVPELEKQILDLQNEKVVLENNVNSSKKEYEDLLKNYNEVLANGKNLVEQLKKSEEISKNAKNKIITNFKKQIQLIEEKYNKEKVLLEQQINELQTKLNTFQNSIKVNTEQLLNIEKEKKEEEDALQKYQKLLFDTLNKPDVEYFRYADIVENICDPVYIQKLSEPVRSIATNICKLTEKYNRLESKHLTLRQTYNNLVTEKDNLSVQLNTKIQEYDNLQKTNKQLMNKLKTTEEKYKVVLKDLEGSKLQYENEKKSLEVSLKENKDELKTKTSLIERLQKLNPKDENVVEMQKEYNKALIKVSDCETEFQKNAKLITEYNNRITNLETTIAELEKTKTTIDLNVQEINKKYGEEMIEKQKLEKQIKELQELKNISNTRYTAIKNQLLSLQDEQKVNMMTIEELKKQVNQITEKYNQILQEYNQLKSEKEILTSTVDKLNKQIKDKEKQLSDLQGKYDILQINLNKKNDEVIKLSKEMENVNGEYQINLSNSSKDNQELKVQIQTLQTKLNESENKLSELNKQYKEQVKNYTLIENKNKELELSIGKFEGEITKLNNKNTTLQNKYDTLNTEYQTIKKEYEYLLQINPQKENVNEIRVRFEKEIETIKNDYINLTNEYKGIQTTLSTTSSELAVVNKKYTTEKDSFDKKKNELIKEIENNKKEITLLQTKINELAISDTDRNKEYNLNIEKLNKTIESLTKKLNETIEEHNKNVEQLNKLNDEKEQQVLDLEIKLKMLNDMNTDLLNSKKQVEEELTLLKKDFASIDKISKKKTVELNNIIDNLQENINGLEKSSQIISNQMKDLEEKYTTTLNKYNKLLETLEGDILVVCDSKNKSNEFEGVCQRIKQYQNEIEILKTTNSKTVKEFETKLKKQSEVSKLLDEKLYETSTQLNLYYNLLESTLSKPDVEYFRYADPIDICSDNYINQIKEPTVKNIALNVCKLTQKYKSLKTMKDSIENKYNKSVQESELLNNRIKQIEEESRVYKNEVVKELMKKNEEEKKKISNEYSMNISNLEKQYNNLYKIFSLYEPENIETLNEMCKLDTNSKKERIQKMYQLANNTNIDGIVGYINDLCTTTNKVAELEDIRKKFNTTLEMNKQVKVDNDNLQKQKQALIQGYSMLYDEFEEEEFKDNLAQMCSSKNLETIRGKYKELSNIMSDSYMKNILGKICDIKLKLRLTPTQGKSNIEIIDECEDDKQTLLRLQSKANEKLQNLGTIPVDKIILPSEKMIYNNLIQLFTSAIQLGNINSLPCNTIRGTLQTLNSNPVYKEYDLISANFLEDYKGQVRVYIKVKPYQDQNKKWLTDINPGSVSRSVCAIQSGLANNYITIDCNATQGVHCTTNSTDYKEYKDFTNIFKPDVTNKDLYDQTKALFDQMKSGYSIVIFGYGLSGSGKTFTLLGEGANEGLIDYVLFDKNNGIKQVEMVYAFELYSNKVPKGPVISGKDTIQAKIIDHYNSSIENEKMIEGKVIKNSDQLKRILMDLETTRKNEKHIKPTPNNPVSSRSHLFLVFKVTFTNGVSGYCTFIDTAGRESPLNLFPQIFNSTNKSLLSNLIGGSAKDINQIRLQDNIKKLYKDTYKISDENILKDIGIDTLKEGMYVNESINHLIWFFNNKAGKSIDYKDKMMNKKTYTEYKDNYIFTKPSVEANQTISESNVKLIPVLNKLSKLGGENTKSKFVMLCMLRQEIKYCEEAKKTLDFATEIKST